MAVIAAAAAGAAPSLAFALVVLVVVALLAWRFGPWMLRWAGFALIATAIVLLATPAPATGSAVVLVLAGAAMWAAGSMWSAARYQRWPGLFSARTLGRLPWPRQRP